MIKYSSGYPKVQSPHILLKTKMCICKRLMWILLFAVISVSAIPTRNGTSTNKDRKKISRILNQVNNATDVVRDDDGITLIGEDDLMKLIHDVRKPGWQQAFQAKAMEIGKKIIRKEKSRSEYRKTIPRKQKDSPWFPMRAISKLNSKLSKFDQDPLAENVKKPLSKLKPKWSSLSDDERDGIAATLEVVSDNIGAFAEAKTNPVGAVKGAVNIISSIASNFGPIGQVVSLGLGFFSSILGLFGKGPEPTPLSEVVKKEIRNALDAFHNTQLINEAKGVITALSASKAYLDGILSVEKQFSPSPVLISARVPITQHTASIGMLLAEIERLMKKNTVSDSKKCLKYVELFAYEMTLQDMILTQIIGMYSNKDLETNGDKQGLIGTRQLLRSMTKPLFKKLYTIDYGSKILPYFDPDVQVIADSYATSLLDLGKYDRSLAKGLYCIQHKNGKDLDWRRSDSKVLKLLSNKPYITYHGRDNDNCAWKFVPHGKNIYSIVTRYNNDPNYDYYGALLGYDTISENGIPIQLATVDYDDPNLWEIDGDTFKRIRNKWGCERNHPSCNKELGMDKIRDFFLRVLVGMKTPLLELLPRAGHIWKFVKRQ